MSCFKVHLDFRAKASYSQLIAVCSSLFVSANQTADGNATDTFQEFIIKCMLHDPSLSPHCRSLSNLQMIPSGVFTILNFFLSYVKVEGFSQTLYGGGKIFYIHIIETY